MLVIFATILAFLVLPGLACQQSSGFIMTFYGWPDNDPPGNSVAYNCGGRNNAAAGNGTYTNPLTMAAAVGIFSVCEIVYSPYLEKYLRLEDTCQDCVGNWTDVWLGSFTSDGGDALSACEDTLTGDDTPIHLVIRSPPDNLQVNGKNLYPIIPNLGV
jgi:hypothetical protein